ncbi:hypothetical protein [Pseudokineococcus marinus]|uniref:hypothetical protein n=1 Tax=Pseudokineococcus marinus TaxID=351215 RepID=UPI001BB2D341|nr:hypothetical protein [Pseudokineococcus marinus]
MPARPQGGEQLALEGGQVVGVAVEALRVLASPRVAQGARLVEAVDGGVHDRAPPVPQRARQLGGDGGLAGAVHPVDRDPHEGIGRQGVHLGRQLVEEHGVPSGTAR